MKKSNKSKPPPPRPWRREIARRCLAWAAAPETRTALHGPGESWLQILNRIKAILGVKPIRREDLPPGQNWDAIPTPKQRKEATYRMWGYPINGKQPDSRDLGYFGPPRKHSGKP